MDAMSAVVFTAKSFTASSHGGDVVELYHHRSVFVQATDPATSISRDSPEQAQTQGILWPRMLRRGKHLHISIFFL